VVAADDPAAGGAGSDTPYTLPDETSPAPVDAAAAANDDDDDDAAADGDDALLATLLTCLCSAAVSTPSPDLCKWSGSAGPTALRLRLEAAGAVLAATSIGEVDDPADKTA